MRLIEALTKMISTEVDSLPERHIVSVVYIYEVPRGYIKGVLAYIGRSIIQAGGWGQCGSCSQTSNEFLYCKNMFMDKLADASSCDNVKTVHI